LKTLFTLVVLGVIGWYAYQKFAGDGPPPVIDNPVYGEMRATANIQGREIEMAIFARMTDDSECRLRSQVFWSDALKDCPSCTVQSVKCQVQLPPRYARLFRDESIPSTYLSASAGRADERDGRLVVYGLTDKEGAAVCEIVRESLLKRYRGTAHCVQASGG
jgi:hypothetical protein